MAKRKMSYELARNILMSIWVGAFLGNILIVVYLQYNEFIIHTEFVDAISSLSTIYVAHIGPILAFYFRDKIRKKDNKPGDNLGLAIVLSVFWNIVVLAYMLRPVFLPIEIYDSIKPINTFCSLLSWLVVPVISYYFATSSPNEPKEATSK